MVHLYERDARAVSELLEHLAEFHREAIGKRQVSADEISMKLMLWCPADLVHHPHDDALRAVIADRLTSIREAIGEQLQAV
jgi:hypothetical protein